jgi:hypothetical protein
MYELQGELVVFPPKDHLDMYIDTLTRIAKTVTNVIVNLK